jgi:hypothetical protein
MVIGLRNLESSNDGTTKRVTVLALGTGGMETVTFNILGDVKSVQANLAATQEQAVSVVHTDSGSGLVTATAGQQSSRRILDLDKQPGDVGTAAP